MRHFSGIRWGLILFAITAGGAIGCSGAGDSIPKRPPAADAGAGAGSTPDDGDAGVAGSPECVNHTQRLEALYEEVSVCTEDADCNYVQDFYEVVPRWDRDEFITTFDCHVVTPFLPVANGRLVQDRIKELTEQAEVQKEACRLPDDAVTCEAFGGYNSSPPATCQRGRCERRPARERGGWGSRPGPSASPGSPWRRP